MLKENNKNLKQAN